jgi:hypothetical protein
MSKQSGTLAFADGLLNWTTRARYCESAKHRSSCIHLTLLEHWGCWSETASSSHTKTKEEVARLDEPEVVRIDWLILFHWHIFSHASLILTCCLAYLSAMVGTIFPK